nr:MAG TPA: tail fiber protein [Caudoviricetes sp.]
MKLTDIPARFNIPFADSAGGGYVRSIPEASQIGVQAGAASLTTGFPPLNWLPVGAGGVPPFGQDMNGILKQITQWSRWQAAGGLAPYNSAFSSAIGGYPKNAILMAVSANHLWFNLVDDNTTNPDSGGANWMPLGQAATQAEVDAGTRNDVFLTPSTLSKTAPDINFNCYATSNQNATPVAAFTVLTTHAKISGSSSAAVTGVNATRFTTPADCAGWYTLFANLAIPIQAGGSISINLRLNGSQFLSSATSLAGAQTNLAVSCSSYFYLSAGDYVEPMFYPTAAGGVIGSGYFTSFAGGLIKRAGA